MSAVGWVADRHLPQSSTRNLRPIHFLVTAGCRSLMYEMGSRHLTGGRFSRPCGAVNRWSVWCRLTAGLVYEPGSLNAALSIIIGTNDVQQLERRSLAALYCQQLSFRYVLCVRWPVAVVNHSPPAVVVGRSTLIIKSRGSQCCI